MEEVSLEGRVGLSQGNKTKSSLLPHSWVWVSRRIVFHIPASLPLANTLCFSNLHLPELYHMGDNTLI